MGDYLCKLILFVCPQDEDDHVRRFRSFAALAEEAGYARNTIDTIVNRPARPVTVTMVYAIVRAACAGNDPASNALRAAVHATNPLYLLESKPETAYLSTKEYNEALIAIGCKPISNTCKE